MKQSFQYALVLLGFVPGIVQGQDPAFSKAFSLYQAGSPEAAKQALLAVGERNYSALDLSLLGTIEFQIGDLAQAEQRLEGAIKKEAGLSGARSTLAKVLEAQGKLDKAEAQLNLLQKRWPLDTSVLLSLARVRNLRGNSEAALAAALEAKRISPNDPGVLYAVGVLCLQMDLFKDGTDNLERAVALEPTPTFKYALASARIANRDFPGAIEIYQDLLKSDADNAQVNYALGAAHFVAGQNDLAKPYFERSVASQPDQVESLYYLALIADQSGDRGKSIDLLRTVIKRSPDHARAHVALGMTYKSVGQLSESRNELEKAVRLSPDSQKAHYQLGLVLTALKEQADASKELAIAKQLRSSADERVSWQLVPGPEGASHGQQAK